MADLCKGLAPHIENLVQNRCWYRGEWQTAAPGWHFMYSATTGDLAFLAELFPDMANYRSNLCCHRCSATKSCEHGDATMSVTNFDEHAHHKATVLTHEAYLESTLPENRSELTTITGWRHDRLLHDICHGQSLGTAQKHAGNTLVYLCESGHFTEMASVGKYPDKLAVCLRVAFQQFQLFRIANKLKCGQPRFTPARVNRRSRQEFPNLSAKAQNCKRVCFWLAAEATSHVRQLEVRARSEDPKEADDAASKLEAARVVATCNYCYCKFMRVLDQQGRILTVEAAAMAKQAGYTHLQSYAWLTKKSMLDKSSMFSIIPKHHYFTHCLDDLFETRLNPRHVQLLSGESFIGYMSRITAACHRARCGDRALSRYVVFFKCQLKKFAAACG
jgi:hypothetical protein